jgi:membrane-bound lytic murein transglycosylase D
MKTILPILTALIFLVVSPDNKAQDNENARLRMENARLRVRIDSLERALNLAKTGGGLSSLESYENTNTFFSLTDAWKDFNVADNTDALTAVSSMDAILKVPHGEAWQKYVDLYSVISRKNMIRILQRYDKWYPTIEDIFKKQGIPTELSYIAIVESAMLPAAVSHAGAVGMWQLMPAAARENGLIVAGTADERYDARKSTQAAAKILKKAYAKYGDWPLAVMSYNCGQGRMDSAIKQYGQGPIDYEDLNRFLPRETRDYLPAISAACYVSENRQNLFMEFHGNTSRP